MRDEPQVRWQRWLYRRILWLLPSGFRGRFGEQMEDLFLDQLRNTPTMGGKARLWWRVVHDAVVQGGAERLGGTRRGAGSPDEREPVASAFLHDLRAAARILAARPALTLPVVLTLGLGIGLASAMTLVIQGVLLKPLPYPDADRLIRISERTSTGQDQSTSFANFADWRAQANLFESMTAVAARTVSVTGGEEPTRAAALYVTADYFRVAGVQPLVGRAFGPAENRQGAEAVVVVGEAFWRESLGSRPSLEGAALGLTDLLGRTASYRVVGVMPRGFDLLGEAQLYLPLEQAVPWSVRGNHVVSVIGRLRSDAPLAAAAAQLHAIDARLRLQYPEVEHVGLTIVPLADEVLGPIRKPLVLLLAGAALLLLIAFSNVAGTLLARGIERQREMQVRAALGASRRRLVAQLVSESLVLAIGSSMVAALVARGLFVIFGSVDASIMPRLQQVVPGWLGLVLVASILASFGVLFFGVSTALLTSRWAAAGLRVREGGAQQGQRVVWRALLGTEVALAFTLLIVAGLLGRSLHRIAAEDTGFDATNVTVVDLTLPGAKYASGEEYVRYFDRALPALRAIPGVTAAGINITLPIPGAGGIAGPITLESGETPDLIAQYRTADAGYFEALSIPLIAGRLFDDGDRSETPHVAVVSESMARRVWAAQDPVGERFTIPGMDGYSEPLTVVGVVADVRPWNVEAGTTPTYYVSYRQRPSFLKFAGSVLVARTNGSAVSPASVREALADLDPDVPFRIHTLDERLGESTADRQFVFSLLGIFAALALLLSGIGIWGVSSFVVSRRVREMGIRLALGAAPSQVRLLLQREAVIPLGLGLGLGTVLALALTRLISGLLFGITSSDTLTFAAAAATLGGTTWLASYLPARRTARLDAMRTLRAE